MKMHRGIIAMSLASALFVGCSEEVVEKKERLRPVRYEVVGSSDAAQIRSFSGLAKAGDEIELSFRSNGIITELNANVGEKVAKGALIAKLDNVQARLSYEQAKSALNAARSALNTSKSNLERVKSLYEKGSNSLSEYEAAKNSYQSTLDQFESSKRNIDLQQTQINYGYIYAPKEGVIARKNGSLNENVSAGQVIAVLNAGDEVNVEVGLPESVINKVSIGMESDIKFSSTENSFKGSVLEISPIVDPSSSTYPIKVEIVEPTEEIKAGMAATVTFDLSGEEESTEGLVVPVNAVGEDGEGNFVFVIEAKSDELGTVSKQRVVIGELTSVGFKVLSGLEGGERIATAGLQTLLDGQSVSIAQ